MKKYVLSIDQGTTSTTAMIFDQNGSVVSRVTKEFPQYFPKLGWVEHDPIEIWDCTISTMDEALREAGIKAHEISALGITNQRETSVFWERETCKPYGKAIVWQCRRSAQICEKLKLEGIEKEIRKRTGLVLDPYFSGTKILWMLENDREFERLATSGELCFGTIDSWLLAKLTGGKVHATDYSNASRTLLFNIKDLTWDNFLLEKLGIPPSILPEVKPSSGIFAETDPHSFFGASVPIAGIAGDQQAALFGQACYQPGMTKNTYGTGSFILMNTGGEAVESKKGMLTTIAWVMSEQVTYALEGSIFITGAAIQWLRDGLRIIDSASETGPIAEKVENSGGIYFVPAFVGLGAPYWDAYARGAILGITRGTTREHIVRAAVEAMAYQTRDVMEAMESDSGITCSSLRVDGGASVMDVLLQFQADLLGVKIERPRIHETTALGAAYLAGLACGIWHSMEEIENSWIADKIFLPSRKKEEMEEAYAGWRRACERAMGWMKSS